MINFRQETLAERVIIKPLVEKTSKGGIVLARSERDQAVNSDQGTIVMIGPLAWYDLPSKPDLKPGDTVYYSKYGAKMLKPEGCEDFYMLCNDKDILVGFTKETPNG